MYCVRPKPIVFVAIQWNGGNASDVADLLGMSKYSVNIDMSLFVESIGDINKLIPFNSWVFIDERGDIQVYSTETFWLSFEKDDMSASDYLT